MKPPKTTHHTLYSKQSALPLSLGPNLASHISPDEQANHQLSIKEKAGVTCTCRGQNGNKECTLCGAECGSVPHVGGMCSIC